MIKNYFLPQIFLLLLIFGVFVADSFSQVASEPPKSADVMSENDALPFMRNQPAAETNSPETGSLLFKTLGAMLLIVGLLFFGAWGLKKAGFDRFRQKELPGMIDLAVLSTVSMGSGRTISAVRFGERVLLVGSTAQNFTLLADESAKDSLSAQTSRSVADLLGEEKNHLFGNEFEQARNRLDGWENTGGKLK